MKQFLKEYWIPILIILLLIASITLSFVLILDLANPLTLGM